MTQPLVIKVVVKLACVFTFGGVGKVLNIAQSSEEDGKLISGNLQPAERERLEIIYNTTPTPKHTHTRTQKINLYITAS